MEAFDRILVRMPNWLGDVVMATPLLRALREAQPKACIDVLVQPGGARLLEGLGLADETLVYRRRGAHDGLRGTLRLAKLLRVIKAGDGITFLSGGLALDEGLLLALNESLEKMNLKLEARNHPDSPYAGAIGAAIWGAFRHEKLAHLDQMAAAS